MYKILYCWEHGSGFGHATKMKNVCNCLEGYDVIIAGKQLDKIQKYFLYNEVSEIYQSPFIQFNNEEFDSGVVTYSQMLMHLGGANIEQVSFLVKAWKNLIERVKPDLVISDFSPTPTLIAKTLEIPVKSIGTGYEIPPFYGSLPSLVPWAAEERENLCQETDERLLTILNESFRNNKLRPLNDLSGVANKDNSLIVSPRRMDHFSRDEGNFKNFRFYETGMADGNIWETYKPKIFFFLKGIHERVLETLINLRYEFEIRGVVANLNGSNRDFLRNKGLLVYNQLLDLEKVFPQTDLLISNGGINILKRAGLHRVNSIIIPSHGEQRLTAYRMAVQGASTVFDPSTNTHIRFEDVVRSTIKSDKSNELFNIASEGIIHDYSDEIKSFIEYS